MKLLRPNTNDNHVGHCLYAGETDHLPYAAAARYLIEKYISAYWKSDPNDIDFIHMELTLCGYLKDCANGFPRKLIIKWMARVLDISPIRLLNDPDLPF